MPKCLCVSVLLWRGSYMQRCSCIPAECFPFTVRWTRNGNHYTHKHTCVHAHTYMHTHAHAHTEWAHSSLILQHHLLFSESRWEGWGKGVVGVGLNGEWVWREGAIKDWEVCIYVCVCVREGECVYICFGVEND